MGRSTGHAVRVAFRTDADAALGLGHLRRCLALAKAIEADGVESHLLLDGDERALDLATTAGVAVTNASGGGDAAVEWCARLGARALVVDSYAFTSDDYRALAAARLPVIAFDDTGERELPVELVVNGSAGAPRLAYRGAAHTRYLLGPRYLALRPEFAEPAPRAIRERVGRALVTTGGADPGRLTARLVGAASAGLGAAVALDVVAGPLVDDIACIRAAVRAAPGRAELYESPEHLRELMRAADLAITGGGQTVYELAATGTPMVAVGVALNQRLNLEAMREAGALEYAGDADDAGLEPLVTAALGALAGDARRRADMSQRGRALVDGRGASRLARAVMDLLAVPRPRDRA